MANLHEHPSEIYRSLREAIQSLEPHEHLCLIYESHEEWVNTVIPFIVTGIRKKEKCIYVVDNHTAKVVRDYLKKEVTDIEEAEGKGQLSIVHEHETYTKEGSFDPDRMITLLIRETEKAISQGYPALRVTGEMTWVLKGHIGSERLIEYEAKLNRDLFPHYPCLAICQYDRFRFDPEIIKGVVLTHPILIRGDTVYKNFFYIPPEELELPPSNRTPL